jgi:tyrosyl-tRNA synthetase
LNPQLLKPAVAQALNELLKPIQEAYQQNKEWQEVALKAYPEPVAPKKEKKVKNKGTRHPGPAPTGPDPTTQEIQELPIRTKGDSNKPE